MKKLLLSLLLLCAMSTSALAATEAIEIYFLPLSEASEAARSQLSANGKIAPIPSRRLLVIEDDIAHINKAKALLKKLDQPTPQFSAMVEIEDIDSKTISSASLSGAVSIRKLSGGWIQLASGQQKRSIGNRQKHQLRISAAQPGRIETGIIRSFTRETRLWLSGYGIIQANSVEMIPITSGFSVTAWPVGKDQVRVRITPCMQRMDTQLTGQHAMLIDLGTARILNRGLDRRVSAGRHRARRSPADNRGGDPEKNTACDQRLGAHRPSLSFFGRRTNHVVRKEDVSLS